MTPISLDAQLNARLLATCPIPGYSPTGTARHQRNTRERKLLGAIVELALDDADQRISGRPTSTGGAAIGWLLSERQHPFSFRWICFALGSMPARRKRPYASVTSRTAANSNVLALTPSH